MLMGAVDMHDNKNTLDGFFLSFPTQNQYKFILTLSFKINHRNTQNSRITGALWKLDKQLRFVNKISFPGCVMKNTKERPIYYALYQTCMYYKLLCKRYVK